MRHGRRVNGKQTGQLLDVLIDDVAMESGSIHLHVVTARTDKCPELIKEPYRIIAHLAKTDNKRVEIRRHSGIGLNLDKAGRMQVYVLLENLDTDV